MVAIFKSKNLDNITHAFFGRTGGTSTGIYCSLNFSKNTNDDNLNVERNHELAFDKLNISKKQIFFPNQQHTNRVLFINEKSKFNNVRHTAADAVITNVEKFGVGILSADCCPVLAFESDSGIIVAIHAGWKGALSGICENTLSVLKKLNVNLKKLQVAIGPTISCKNYEVRIDFFNSFLSKDHSFERFFDKVNDKYFFNLASFVESRFELFDVYNIKNLNLCTYENHALFFSNRRANHYSESDFGRMASVICL